MRKLLALVLLFGCTSITVQPVKPPTPAFICIEENPKVAVSDFLPAIRSLLSAHGIRSEVVQKGAAFPDRCEAVLTYVAYKRWDFDTYLVRAELYVEREHEQIGYAEYHLRGNGGLSFFKWQASRTKMEPVIDRLFGEK